MDCCKNIVKVFLISLLLMVQLFIASSCSYTKIKLRDKTDIKNFSGNKIIGGWVKRIEYPPMADGRVRWDEHYLYFQIDGNYNYVLLNNFRVLKQFDFLYDIKSDTLIFSHPYKPAEKYLFSFSGDTLKFNFIPTKFNKEDPLFLGGNWNKAK